METNTIYSGKENVWLCERCWRKEDRIYAVVVNQSALKTRKLRAKESEAYKQLNSVRDVYSPTKKKHYGIPAPIEIE